MNFAATPGSRARGWHRICRSLGSFTQIIPTFKVIFMFRSLITQCFFLSLFVFSIQCVSTQEKKVNKKVSAVKKIDAAAQSESQKNVASKKEKKTFDPIVLRSKISQIENKVFSLKNTPNGAGLDPRYYRSLVASLDSKLKLLKGMYNRYQAQPKNLNLGEAVKRRTTDLSQDLDIISESLAR